MPSLNRREWLAALGGGATVAYAAKPRTSLASTPARKGDLKITNLRITPIALPDPPIMAASGCHGPYFLRNVIELETDGGIVGIGETRGGERATRILKQFRETIVGESVFAYRKFATSLLPRSTSCYSGLELACLDAIGRANGRRLCELLGGPVRESVEFAAYLFFRYAADHPRVLDDSRLVDDRGSGHRALDVWGDVRTPESMARMAHEFGRKWGFRVYKLKAGVLTPDTELDALTAMNECFGGKCPLRIDPNGRWTMDTALRIGQSLKQLPLEYYEDPVVGQKAMAELRQKTGLPLGTNSCVTRFEHIPKAVVNEPIDVVLGDHHGWGGITAFQTLGTMTDVLGWGLSQHSNNHAGITMAAMIHVGAVTPQLTFASDTHYVWLVEGADIIDGPNLPIRGGYMEVPKGPGVGVELDRDKLARAHEVYEKCGMRQRDDGRTMKRFQPGWKRTLY